MRDRISHDGEDADTCATAKLSFKRTGILAVLDASMMINTCCLLFSDCHREKKTHDADATAATTATAMAATAITANQDNDCISLMQTAP